MKEKERENEKRRMKCKEKYIAYITKGKNT